MIMNAFLCCFFCFVTVHLQDVYCGLEIVSSDGSLTGSRGDSTVS